MRYLSPADRHAHVRPKSTLERRAFGELQLIDIESSPGEYRAPPTDFWTLQIITHGAVDAALDFGCGKYRGRGAAGHMILSTAAAEHRYKVTGDHQLVTICIPAAASLKSLAAESVPVAADFGALHARFWRDARVRALGLDIWRAAKGDRFAPSMCADEAQLALVASLARASGANLKLSAQDRLSPAARRRVLEFIETNLAGDCSLRSLAAAAGLSPFHFARAFRHDLGEAPHWYVLLQRVERAKRLLRESRFSVGAVAALCGFATPSRMSDTFARLAGVTPRAYRAATQ